MRQFIRGVLAAAALVAVTAWLVIIGGAFPIAAVESESAITTKLIHTAYEQAVARQSRSIQIPTDLQDESKILRGAYNFQTMCTLCHTPPETDASVQAQGMNPRPPALPELMARRTAEEAFWVIKNGIRMTAMPAFGPSHDDEELWALVAFLQDDGAKDAATYRAMLERGQQRYGADDGHDHSHGDMPDSTTAGPTHHQIDEHANHEHDQAQVHHAEKRHQHAAASPATMSAQLIHALSESDVTTLKALMADDVLIFESGGVENGFDDYAGHHMPSDMAFLREIQRTPLAQTVFEFGDHALVANRSHLHGQFKERAIDLMSTETLLLKRGDDGRWKVQHIHWSSGKAH